MRVVRVRAVPNPESTGKYLPAVSQHEALGVQAVVSAVQNLEILKYSQYLFLAGHISK